MNKILITSSQELSPELKTQIESRLKLKFGDKVFEYQIDPTLILGLVVKAGDEEFYYNLQHEISHILNELLS